MLFMCLGRKLENVRFPPEVHMIFLCTQGGEWSFSACERVSALFRRRKVTTFRPRDINIYIRVCLISRTFSEANLRVGSGNIPFKIPKKLQRRSILNTYSIRHDTSNHVASIADIFCKKKFCCKQSKNIKRGFPNQLKLVR